MFSVASLATMAPLVSVNRDLRIVPIAGSSLQRTGLGRWQRDGQTGSRKFCCELLSIGRCKVQPLLGKETLTRRESRKQEAFLWSIFVSATGEHNLLRSLRGLSSTLYGVGLIHNAMVTRLEFGTKHLLLRFG